MSRPTEGCHLHAAQRRDLPRRHAVQRRGREVQHRAHADNEDSRRKAELSAVASVDVLAPDQVRLNLKEPFAPLLSILSDRAGMMVSPAAGAKEGLCHNNRSAPGRTNSSSGRPATSSGSKSTTAIGTRPATAYDEIVYSYIADIDRPPVACPGGRHRRRRAHGSDRHQDDPGRQEPQAAWRAGLAVSHLMVKRRQWRKGQLALGKDARLRRAFELSIRPIRHQPRGLQRRVHGRQPDDPTVGSVLFEVEFRPRPAMWPRPRS